MMNSRYELLKRLNEALGCIARTVGASHVVEPGVAKERTVSIELK